MRTVPIRSTRRAACPHRHRQHGGALIALVVVVIAVLLGAVITTLVRDNPRVESEIRASHRLGEARDALVSATVAAWCADTAKPVGAVLLDYLPCPTGPDGTTCVAAGDVGRLPWRRLELRPPTDADGECLWYRRMTGGQVPAVVVAAGAATGTQTRSAGVVCSDEPDADNYLDAVFRDGVDHAAAAFGAASDQTHITLDAADFAAPGACDPAGAPPVEPPPVDPPPVDPPPVDPPPVDPPPVDPPPVDPPPVDPPPVDPPPVEPPADPAECEVNARFLLGKVTGHTNGCRTRGNNVDPECTEAADDMTAAGCQCNELSNGNSAAHTFLVPPCRSSLNASQCDPVLDALEACANP